jgi:hypothetical protein
MKKGFGVRGKGLFVPRPLKHALLALLALGSAPSVTCAQTISSLPSGGLVQSTDWLPAVRNGSTVKVQPFNMPASGSVLVSSGTASPYGVVPVNGSCLEGVGSAWMAVPCVFSNTVTVTGSPVAGNLTKFSSGNIITSADLTGDCATSGTLSTTCTKTNGVNYAASATTDTTNASNISSGTLPAGRLPALTGDVTTTVGTAATTVSQIQGTSVSGTTGTGNVVLSAAPTMTGNVTVGALVPTGTSPSGTTAPSIWAAAGGEMDFTAPNLSAGSNPDFSVLGAVGSSTAHLVATSGAGSTSLTVAGSAGNASLTIANKGVSDVNVQAAGTGNINLQTHSTGTVLKISDTASSVNFWTATGGATGSPGRITLSALGGSDTDVNARIQSKGAGAVELAGHIASIAGGNPSINSCGTSASLTTATDSKGRINTGTGAPTSCAINFGTTWTATPVCVVTTDSSSSIATISSISTTVLTVTLNPGLTSGHVYYICMQ